MVGPTTCEEYRPPTSARPVNPGVSVTRLFTCFVLIGSASSSSRVTTCWRRTFCTSTTGVAPVTVIVSSMPPTASTPSTLAVKPVVSSMPSRMTVLKPGRLKVTV